MKILSEKCEMSQEEVLKRYDEFKNDFPEGEITKDQFLENKVTLGWWSKDIHIIVRIL